jgi:hypothetical protein
MCASLVARQHARRRALSSDSASGCGYERFVRDYVDSRRNVGEYFLPAVFTVLVLSVIHNKVISLITFSSRLFAALITTVLSRSMTRQFRRIVAAKFPDEPPQRVLRMYGWLRSTPKCPQRPCRTLSSEARAV